MMYLASSGDEVKIWDAQSFALKEQFSPHETTINDLCWSHGGNHLASCSKNSNSVVFRKINADHSVPADSFSVPVNNAGVVCLDFSSDISSRYILCGCTDGKLHIWDRKGQKFKKTFPIFKSSVTRARWNFNDDFIALSSDKGKIVVCNVVSGVVSSPFSPASTEAVSQLMYNPYSKSSLVSVSEGGSVNLWDTNTSRQVHAFRQSHQAPARDLAFSPINNHLMVSVGLDKRCVFYDLQNKKPLNTIMSEHPLTSVALMEDGSTLVVGSSRGKLFVYDIRQDSSPILTLPAHGSSVKCLSFVNRDDLREDSGFSQGLRRQLPLAPSSMLDNLNLNNSNGANETRTGIRTDILSPFREGNSSSIMTDPTGGSEMSWNMSKLRGDLDPSTHDQSSHDPSAMYSGLISPLRGGDSSSIMSNSNTSLFSQMFPNSRENSHHHEFTSKSRDTSHHHHRADLNAKSRENSHVEFTTAKSRENSLEQPTSRENLHHLSHQSSRTPPQYESPPRHHPSRGMGASPSLPHLASPTLQGPSFHTAESPTRHAASEMNSTQLSTMYDNRSQDMYSPRLKTMALNGLGLPAPHSLTNVDSEPSARPSTPPNSNLRLWVRDLLKEQLQEHQDQLKQEIRDMISSQAVVQGAQGAEGGVLQAAAPGGRDPGMFQAEFIRNLIREEVEDQNEKIHEEFWDLKLVVLKQVFLLEKRLEAGFAECMINPLLLDEIDRLKEENSRLRKTF